MVLIFMRNEKTEKTDLQVSSSFTKYLCMDSEQMKIVHCTVLRCCIRIVTFFVEHTETYNT